MVPGGGTYQITVGDVQFQHTVPAVKLILIGRDRGVRVHLLQGAQTQREARAQNNTASVHVNTHTKTGLDPRKKH